MADGTPTDPAEWASRGDLLMPLNERIRQLRTEAHLTQGELADKVGTDARTISRYEHGHVIPSIDAVVRIAQALNVSIDHLLIDEIPRRPLHSPDHGLGDYLDGIAELDDNDRASLLNILDALITRRRVKAIAATDIGSTPRRRSRSTGERPASETA